MGERFVVQRDYTNGLITQWEDVFPNGLEQYGVSEDDFHRTIHRLNDLFKQTETYQCTSFIESCIGCLSLYTFYLCFSGQYRRGKKRIEEYLEEQNRLIYSNSNTRWLNPFNNGLLNVCKYFILFFIK